MRKHNMKYSFYRVPGFLLLECLIAFAMLSFAIVASAGGLIWIVKEYSQATQRLRLLEQAQALIELSWQGHDAQADSSSLRVNVRPVEHVFNMPNKPPLKLIYVEGSTSKPFIPAGCIKEG